MKRFFILGVITLLLVFLCCGCDEVATYRGEHKDLAAVVLFSIPGARSTLPDQYLVLETDEYGRTLFATISGDSYFTNGEKRMSICAVLVLQKSDDTHVYFYGEENYIFFLQSHDSELTQDFVSKHFTEEAIESLKLANDWGKTPEKTQRKCVKAPILLKADYEPGKAGEKAIKELTGYEYSSIGFRKSESGQKIYHIKGDTENDRMGYVILLEKDGSFSGNKNAIMKLRGPEYLAEDMKTFMERNSWVDITE
jgi:hypothetical protein